MRDGVERDVKQAASNEARGGGSFEVLRLLVPAHLRVFDLEILQQLTHRHGLRDGQNMSECERLRTIR